MKKRILWALAACLLLVLAAGGAQAEGEKVYTSGDYSYTLNSYGEATLLSMPAPEDAAEPLLVPSVVKGHKVIYLDASCVPVDVDEVLLPQGCFMRHYQMQTHEFRAYWYLDYERIREQSSMTGFPIPM